MPLPDNTAFMIRLLSVGDSKTLWSGDLAMMPTMQGAIDDEIIKSEGLYVLMYPTKSLVRRNVRPYNMQTNIYTVAFNDHGELGYHSGFYLGGDQPVNPRRIHRWPH